jgi:hypothetical protein
MESLKYWDGKRLKNQKREDADVLDDSIIFMFNYSV